MSHEPQVDLMVEPGGGKRIVGDGYFILIHDSQDRTDTRTLARIELHFFRPGQSPAGYGGPVPGMVITEMNSHECTVVLRMGESLDEFKARMVTK